MTGRELDEQQIYYIKYRQCLLTATMCHNRYEMCRNPKKADWWLKWYNKWLNLAIHFTEKML